MVKLSTLEQQKLDEMLKEFDWKFYVSYYDLPIKTETMAKLHFKNYGFKEGRICCQKQISNLEKHVIDLATESITEPFINLQNNLSVKIDIEKDTFIYYSKTNYKILFQRPHQIMRFFDKSFNKIFIGIVDNIIYEEKYNLWIVPYEKREEIYKMLQNNIVTTYFTDPRLYNEIELLNGKKMFDLIDAPIDEFAVWKPNLEKCVKMADYVTYSHPELVTFLNKIDDTKKYYYISNACDYEYFSQAKNRIGERPKDFIETDKKILGYYGAFAKWLDYDIIKKYADEGIYHIVMIGGISNCSTYNIRIKHPNITWLDHKPYEELAYYLSWFDVCFLPFKDCELTKYVNPCKLWEYMASEKEIIKTNVNMEIIYCIKCDDYFKNFLNIFENIHLINKNKICKQYGFNDFNLFKKNVINKYENIFITLPSIPWDCTLYQRPQHIANAFASLGFLSIYITTYASDNLDVNFKQISNNLWLVNDSQYILTIKGAYYSTYSTSWNLHFRRTYDTIHKHNGFLVYEYIDHIDEKISGNKEVTEIQLKNKYFAFSNYSDLIIASADSLYDEVKLESNSELLMVKNGVSVNDYLSKKYNYHNLPRTFVNFRKKNKIICGYYGAIAPWLDYDIIKSIVNLRKDIGFVFIGPDYLNCLQFLPINCENFYYVGEIPYKILPFYAFTFDICFIPFAEGDIAKTTSPLKLYEYFALQKPVIVSKYMNECIKYKEVLSYNSINEFSNMIDKAITLINNTTFKERLLCLAYDNDWNKKAYEFSEKLKKLKYKNTNYLYKILLSNTTNLFKNNIEYNFITKWGVDVCSILFEYNNNIYLELYNEYNYLTFSFFGENEETNLFISINDKLFEYKIQNKIAKYKIDITSEYKLNLNIKLYTNKNNTLYFKTMILE
jgi:hypothetical protein